MIALIQQAWHALVLKHYQYRIELYRWPDQASLGAGPERIHIDCSCGKAWDHSA